MRIQPSELDKLEFYRAEILIENLKEHTEKEKEQSKKENVEDNSNMPDASSMMKKAEKTFSGLTKSSSYKMPNLSNFKI